MPLPGQRRTPAHTHPLTSEHERELVLVAADSDQHARDEFVEAFLPLIGGVARHYRGCPSVAHGELMQEGVVGLLCALRHYDSDRETRFWPYASWWVRRAMQQLVAQMRGPIVLSDRALRQLARLNRARRAHLQAHGCEPTARELADQTGLSSGQIASLLAVERTPRGLADPINADGGSTAPLSEMLADPNGEDTHEHVADQLELEELRQLPGGLCARERDVVSAHYGLDRRQQTLREIAGPLGLSAERARQIEQEALSKVRAAADA